MKPVTIESWKALGKASIPSLAIIGILSLLLGPAMSDPSGIPLVFLACFLGPLGGLEWSLSSNWPVADVAVLWGVSILSALMIPAVFWRISTTTKIIPGCGIMLWLFNGAFHLLASL
jgi:hypothetical protein